MLRLAASSCSRAWATIALASAECPEISPSLRHWPHISSKSFGWLSLILWMPIRSRASRVFGEVKPPATTRSGCNATIFSRFTLTASATTGILSSGLVRQKRVQPTSSSFAPMRYKFWVMEAASETIRKPSAWPVRTAASSMDMNINLSMVYFFTGG